MQGKSFIHAVLSSGNLKLFRQANRDLYIEAEYPLLDYVNNYLDHYGALPTPGIVTGEGHQLPALRGGSDQYYYDLLKSRKAHSEVNERHPHLRAAMNNGDVNALLTVLREMTVAVSPLASIGLDYQTLAQSALEVEADYRLLKSTSTPPGIPFGWPTADRATCGMQGGDLVSIAGRPSMGKSKALLEIGHNAITIAGVRTAVVSAEMPKKQLALRIVGRMAGINTSLIRRGTLGTHAEHRLEEVVGTLEEDYPNLYLLSTSSLEDISALVSETQPELLLIDSAYLLRPRNVRKGMARWEVLSMVTGELRQMALALRIPIVITIQFNRSRTSRSKTESDLSELGGTDSYGQDSSIVLGLRQGAAPYQHCRRTVDIVKNREGDCPTFTTDFSFSPPRMIEIVGGDGDDAELVATPAAPQPLSLDWMV